MPASLLQHDQALFYLSFRQPHRQGKKFTHGGLREAVDSNCILLTGDT